MVPSEYAPHIPHGAAAPLLAASLIGVALLAPISCAHPKDGGILGADIIKGNGNRTTETRSLAHFARVRVEDGVTLELTAGAFSGSEAVAEVTTDSNLVEHVETRVEGETLIVGRGHRTSSDLGYRVAVTAPTPSDMTVTEGGRLRLVGERAHGRSGPVRARALNGGELVAKNLRSKRLQVTAVRAADARLAGSVRHFDVEASRSAEIEAEKLRARRVQIRASTASSIRVCATRLLRGRLSFRAKLVYDCNPKRLEVEVGASATMRALE